MTRWPVRAPSPSWWPRSGRWHGWCRAPPRRSPEVCTLDYSKGGKPYIDWDDPQVRQDLVSDLVNDALRLLEVLAGPGAPERDAAAADVLGLLALVAGQDVEPAEGSDGTDGRLADRAESRPGPGDQHRGHRGSPYSQVEVEAAGRVPRARGRRAGDRADHRLRDDDGRRGRQHRCGQRGEDGLPRPVPRRRGRRRQHRGRPGGRAGIRAQPEP